MLGLLVLPRARIILFVGIFGVTAACGARTPLFGAEDTAEQSGDASTTDAVGGGADGADDGSTESAGDGARDGGDADAKRDGAPDARDAAPDVRDATADVPPPPPDCYTFANHAAQVAVSSIEQDHDDINDTRYDNFNCALRDDGVACCWGSESHGELGDGNEDFDDPLPTFVTSSPGGYANGVLHGIKQIAAGGFHACALMNDGHVRCWGQRDRVGNNSGSDVVVPVALPGISDAIAITAGEGHSCALHASGAISCWGVNSYGQLGNGTTLNAPVPVLVSSITNAVAVSAGSWHTCAVLADGSARCWGRNDSGQVGNRQPQSLATAPVPVIGLTDATQIAAGGWRTCAIRSDETVVCWGELARIGVAQALAPTPVAGLANVKAITSGYFHSCAIDAGGAVLCWGDNRGFFQLGRGWSLGVLGVDRTVKDYTLTPVQPIFPNGGVQATSVRAESYATCVSATDGRVFCWGFGANLSSTPVPVPSFR